MWFYQTAAIVAPPLKQWIDDPLLDSQGGFQRKDLSPVSIDPFSNKRLCKYQALIVSLSLYTFMTPIVAQLVKAKKKKKVVREAWE